jgi:hypothetical protein
MVWWLLTKNALVCVLYVLYRPCRIKFLACTYKHGVSVNNQCGYPTSTSKAGRLYRILELENVQRWRRRVIKSFVRLCAAIRVTSVSF